MTTFESIFPTFLTLCGELHTLLLSVAFALFIVGVIVTMGHRSSHLAMLNLLMRVLLLTSLLVFLPAWGNTLQNLLQSSILSGLGVDPANVYQQYNQLLDIKRDASTPSSWWNVMSQLHNFTTDIIVSAVLLLVGCLASVLMFWAYLIQAIILNLGYALSPLLIGFMALPALKHIGNRYLLNLLGVLLWPLGWALAALITQGMLDFLTDPTFAFIAASSSPPGLQQTIGVAVVGFWIIFSTIAAPVVIQKVVSSGALGGGELLAGGTSAAIQTASAAVSGATAAAPLGPLAVVGAGGAAGGLTLLSTASGTGHAGSLVTSLGGLVAHKSDPTGDKAVRQLLTQLAQHLGQLPPITPANGLPTKL